MELGRTFDFPEGIGPRDMYLLYHEEMESLTRHLPEIRRMRFWMTFSESYLTHLRVLENVGMTRIDPVLFEGREIVPLRFLKALLPDPASLGPRTKGKTCIGIWARGEKEGTRRYYYVYNTCDHQECFRETGAQGGELHDRRTGRPRRQDAAHRRVERQRRVQYGTIRPRSIHGRSRRVGPAVGRDLSRGRPLRRMRVRASE